MAVVQELEFTTSEAAFIADLPQREIQKAFDEEWFDTAHVRDVRGATRRWLRIPELVHLRLLKDVARHAVLQNETKKTIHRQLRERMPDLVLVSDETISIFEVKGSSDRRARRDNDWKDLLSVLQHAVTSTRSK